MAGSPAARAKRPILGIDADFVGVQQRTTGAIAQVEAHQAPLLQRPEPRDGRTCSALALASVSPSSEAALSSFCERVGLGGEEPGAAVVGDQEDHPFGWAPANPAGRPGGCARTG